MEIHLSVWDVNIPRKSTGEYADPPYNIAVQHMEQRIYNSPITGTPTSKLGNAYYHAYLPCLQTNWPAILAGQLATLSNYNIGQSWL